MKDTRSGEIQFFMLPDEFKDWLANTIRVHSLHLVRVLGRTYLDLSAVADMPDGLDLYILFKRWPQSVVLVHESPGAAGGVAFTPPRWDRNRLLMGYMSFKAPTTRADSAASLYRTLARDLRKHMEPGIWGGSWSADGKVVRYRDVWCSSLASAFSRAGGELRQFPLGTVLFRTEEDAPSPTGR